MKRLAESVMFSWLAISFAGCGAHVDEPERSVPEEAPYVVECADCGVLRDATVDACGTQTAKVNAERASRVAFALDESVHELIACGAMTRSLSYSLIEGIIELLMDPSGGSLLPSDFEFREGGTYHTKSSPLGAEVEMSIGLFVGADGEAVLIEENLFELDSYLLGAKLDASVDVDFDWRDPFGTTIDVEEPRLRYDRAGPWASLLGLGDPPPNPIRITDFADFSPRFDDIRARVRVHYKEERQGVRIAYDVESPPIGFDELIGGGRIAFEVRSLSATSETMTLVLSEGGWSIAFGDGNALEGRVLFTVTGDFEPISGALLYEQSAYAEIAMECS